MQKTFLDNFFYGKDYKSFSIDYALYNEERQLVLTDIFNVKFEDVKKWIYCTTSIEPPFFAKQDRDGKKIILMPLFSAQWLGKRFERGRSQIQWYYGYVNRIYAIISFTIDKEDLKTVRKSSVKAVKFQNK